MAVLPRDHYVMMSQKARPIHESRRRTADDFWAVVKRGESSECWPFAGRRDKWGYGVFHMRKTKRAHRLAWEFSNGEIPDGLFVCHHCDNPICCNPSHLFLGTATDNAADRTAKQREARGEDSGVAKLTEVAVREIRGCVKTAQEKRLAAEILGVTRQTINDILTRKTWRHVA